MIIRKPVVKQGRINKVELDAREKARLIGKLGLCSRLDLLELCCMVIQQPMFQHQRDLYEEYAEKAPLSAPIGILPENNQRERDPQTQESVTESDVDNLLAMRIPETPQSLKKRNIPTAQASLSSSMDSSTKQASDSPNKRKHGQSLAGRDKTAKKQKNVVKLRLEDEPSKDLSFGEIFNSFGNKK